jgi:hypothetical protein
LQKIRKTQKIIKNTTQKQRENTTGAISGRELFILHRWHRNANSGFVKGKQALVFQHSAAQNKEVFFWIDNFDVKIEALCKKRSKLFGSNRRLN